MDNMQTQLCELKGLSAAAKTFMGLFTSVFMLFGIKEWKHEDVHASVELRALRVRHDSLPGKNNGEI